MRLILMRVLLVIMMKLPESWREAAAKTVVIVLILCVLVYLAQHFQKPGVEPIPTEDIKWLGDPAERSSGFPYEKRAMYDR